VKFGIRRASLRKRIAARTSWKRVVRHQLGFKAPRGWPRPGLSAVPAELIGDAARVAWQSRLVQAAGVTA
jgi:hypothetical protein